MSEPHHIPRVDASDSGSTISDRIQGFVDAWESGIVPTLADHLPGRLKLDARWAVLCELVKVDLEYRWGERNLPKRLEDYAADYPEFAARSFPPEVILEEYHARRRAGFEPGPKEYFERFPDRVRELRQLFGDSSDTAASARSSSRSSGSSVPPEAFLDRLLGSGVLAEPDVAGFVEEARTDAVALADRLVGEERLTELQADRLLRDRPIVLGEYLLVERLGAGGMGEVFRAVHRRMNRLVALKILPDHLVHTADDVARFEREVRAAAHLVHPNIVTAYDAGEKEGVHFLVTELVDGPNLKQLVLDGTPLPIPAAVEAIRQVAEGLRFAHERGIVHRDVKPSNLLVDRDGRVKVLDMGLARFDRGEMDETTLTSSGMVMGTVDYMSPEQALDARRADARADLYSLGCTLYFLLTARPPYRGTTAMERVVAHRERAVPLLCDHVADVPVRLEAAFARMMAKSPDERFQSAAETLQALEGLETSPISVGNWSARRGHETDPLDATPYDREDEDAPAMRSTRVGGVNVATPAAGTVPVDETMRAPRSSSHGSAAWAGLGLARTIGPVVVSLLVLVAVAYGLRALFVPSGEPDPSLTGPENTGPNRALRFNGWSSYVVVDSLDITEQDAFTVEFFAVVEEPRTANIVSWLGPNWFVVYESNGAWGTGVEGSQPLPLLQATGTVREGRRVHVAATWDGKRKQLFLDGRPAAAHGEAYPLRPTKGGLYIGGVPPGLLPEDERDRWYGGTLDEVRISRGVRYVEPFEPRDRPVADDDTIALYRFDEGEGDVVLDSSGHEHHGRVFNAEWVDATVDSEPPGDSDDNVPRVITRDDGWYDVLALYNGRYDSPPGGGEWIRTPEYLESPAAEYARISIPVAPRIDYRLRVEFERIEGNDAIDVYLPVATRTVLFVFDGWGGGEGLCGLQAVNGKNKPDPAAHEGVSGVQIENGRRYVAEFRVIGNGDDVTIGVQLDGEYLVSWTGPISSLRLIDQDFTLLDTRRLGLAAWNSVVRFHAMELMVRDGQAAEILR